VECHYAECSLEETRLSAGLKSVVKMNVVILGLFLQSVIKLSVDLQCHYAECCSAESCGAIFCSKSDVFR
jgi:hypothetical protein